MNENKKMSIKIDGIFYFEWMDEEVNESIFLCKKWKQNEDKKYHKNLSLRSSKILSENYRQQRMTQQHIYPHLSLT